MSRGLTSKGVCAAVLIGILAMLVAAAARATTYTVATTNDDTSDASCSLRDAINAANGRATSTACNTPKTGNDTINISVTGTISLKSVLPEISDGILTINGPTTSPGITIDGGGSFRVLFMNTVTLNVNNVTIANGSASGESGGGIDNAFGGELTVTDCTFSGNSADLGGAIASTSGSALKVTNSSFYNNSSYNNRSPQGGGAIYLESSTLNVINSTFSGNSANGTNGGGIDAFLQSMANVKGTILAENSGRNCSIAGTLNDDGYNISDDGSCRFFPTRSARNGDNVNPMLAALASNGGPTMTFALPSTSPAVDAIPHASCTDFDFVQLTTDQRGLPRPDPEDGPTGPCDIGAYEFQAPSRVGGVPPPIDCSTATASTPNLTALLPVMFFPEYIFGVTDSNGGYNLKITGVTQDKKPTGFPLCPNAFWSGTTTYVRTNNEPLQLGPSGLLYQIQFTATDNATGLSCTGAAPVCVQGLFQSQSCKTVSGAIDATKCP